MRSRWFMSGPKAFSIRKAISGVSVDFPWRRSDSVARRTFKMPAAFDTLSPRASTISVLMRSPGWGGFFMGIASLLVVVDQVNIACRVSLLVVAENQAPVSGDGQDPESFQVALEWMQLPAWEPCHLVQRIGGFEGEQEFAQFV